MQNHDEGIRHSRAAPVEIQEIPVGELEPLPSVPGPGPETEQVRPQGLEMGAAAPPSRGEGGAGCERHGRDEC